MCSLPPPVTLFSFSYSSLCATSKYGGIGGAPHSPRHLSFMKQGPSTMRHLRIHCTSTGSVKLVEHELWQWEEKGVNWYSSCSRCCRGSNSGLCDVSRNGK